MIATSSPTCTMKWFNQAVKPHFSWPDCTVEIPFEGHNVILQPLTDKHSATVSLFDPKGTTFDKGGTLVSRFLSRLAWSMGGGVVELFETGSNNPEQPGQLGRGTYGISGCSQVSPWDYLYLPSATKPHADLALALFREAMSVNSVPFSFLSYFKVLNIAFDKGAKQKSWINQNIEAICYQPAATRLQDLRKSTDDIGKYLYGQGRCAIAHAYSPDQLVNPDKYGDKRRLELDLPLMKELSALFIEREFGVLSIDSFWMRLKQEDQISVELLKKVCSESKVIRYVPNI